MIASQDRSGWFGASDVGYIVGNWETKSFEKWWQIKNALDSSDFKNEAMLAGTYYEHKILEFIGSPEMDKQILIFELRLRVNLDGNSDDTIYEVKTYRNDKGFKVPLKYKRQVWVQLYASDLKKAYIVAYGLNEQDYKNFYNDIDGERLSRYEIEPNEDFINNDFLPKIKYLAHCLNNGLFPRKERYEQWITSNAGL